MHPFHTPVLLSEVLELLHPQPGDVVVDATLGGAGHALALADAVGPSGRLIGFDRDPDAIAEAQRRLAQAPCPVALIASSFAALDAELRELGLDPEGGGAIDVLLADLGVSSHQLDTPERGFSFGAEGPLDMRMAQDGDTALDYLAAISEDALARALREGGDVPRSRRLARALKEAHAAGELLRTSDLRALCERQLGRPRRGQVHPATTVFQALRIAVNDELGALDTLLAALPRWMRAGGRVGIIAFHSGEDRRVKHAFRHLESPCVCPPDLPVCGCGAKPFGRVLTRKPLGAGPAELAANPRARSAHLRGFEFAAPQHARR